MTTTRNDHEASAAEERDELLKLARLVPENVLPVVTAYLSGLVNGRVIGIMSREEG